MALGARSPSHLVGSQIFGQAELNERFWRDGFVVAPFLDPAEISQLTADQLRIQGAVEEGFQQSWFASLEARSEADRAIRTVIAGKISAILPAYRVVFGTLLSKGYKGNTAFPFHNDPSVVDERRYTAPVFWMPLVDVDEQNGCIHAVKGSHLLDDEPRPSFTAFPYGDQEKELRAYEGPIRMRAGEALFFHPAVFHSSPANQSVAARPVVGGVVAPRSAPTQFYRRRGESDVVEIFDVEDSFYLRMGIGDDWSGLVPVAEHKLVRAPLDLSSLATGTS